MAPKAMLTLILIQAMFAASYSAPCPIVNTANGQVNGTGAYIKHEKSRKVFIYNAIPFAKPPVGELRFKPPKKLTTKWAGVRDGTMAKNTCLIPKFYLESLKFVFPQKKNHVQTFSEDCLNLNVYTTNVNSTAKMPVIVWIYGGGFGAGTNQDFDGTAMASLHDVVVVIPNYRLNVFGFLSFGPDSILPGNMGLLDQVMALKWIQENIENFGGDPTSVTLMGESAGGNSIGHMINSDQAKGLFHKAVLFSGVATSENTLHTEEQRVKTEKTFLEIVGLNDTDGEIALNKLQAMDSEVLLDAYQTLLQYQLQLYPVVDGVYIKKHPLEQLETVSPVPSIIITNDHEGFGIMSSFIPGYYEGFSEEFAKPFIVNNIKVAKPAADPELVYEKFKEHYLQRFEYDHLFYSKLYASSLGDPFYHYRAFQTAFKFSGKTDVYYGYGSFQLHALHNASYNDGIKMKPDWINCDHGDDLFVSLGTPFLDYEIIGDPRFTEGEKTLSERIMAYVANFATNGDPNIGEEGLPSWPAFTSEEPNVLKLAVPDMTVDTNVHTPVVNFWSQDYTCKLVKYSASNIVGFEGSDIMVDPGFVDSLNRLNEYAMDQKLTVVVFQSFRKDGDVLDKSSAMVGHSLGVKFKLRRKKLCGRSCTEGSKSVKTERFLSNLRFNTALQWKYDSNLESDLIEIDDGIGVSKPMQWDELLKAYQEFC